MCGLLGMNLDKRPRISIDVLIVQVCKLNCGRLIRFLTLYPPGRKLSSFKDDDIIRGQLTPPVNGSKEGGGGGHGKAAPDHKNHA